MKRLQRAALLVNLAQKLRRHGSWCGETHLQKGVYILQYLAGVPFELDYCLYKHGPFSFELSDELTSLRADKIFDQEKQPYPYGPKLKPGEMANKVRDLYPKTIAKYEQHIQFVADSLAASDVKTLERLATALYVTREEGDDAAVESRAQRLHEIKPHVTFDEACEAVRKIDLLQREASRLLAA